MLRNAKTAEIYATTKFITENNGECSETRFDLMDMEVREFYADPGDDPVPFLEPWAIP